MLDWFVATLRNYPEIAIFLSLAIGYFAGKFTYRGLGLGVVTSTLLAGVIIGQLDIAVSPHVKSVFFLLFLFSVGYGVGPQFVRGLATDGLPQAAFAVIVCMYCIGTPIILAKLAGYGVGTAAGFYAGSQTNSASLGLATDAINRLGLASGELDALPIAYAVAYLFGTAGSAMILAVVGPRLLGIDLVAACRDFEARQGEAGQQGGAGSAWHRFAMRAYRIRSDGPAVGLTVAQAEGLLQNTRVFVLRICRTGEIIEADTETVLQADDIVAVAAPTESHVGLVGAEAEEVHDPKLLDEPILGVDVFVTSKEVDGKTLSELAMSPATRGVFLRRIVRGFTASRMPILPQTTIQRGDVLTIVGRSTDVASTIRHLGRPDHATNAADMAFIAAAITVGALFGSLVVNVGGVPLTLSTAGGALISGLLFGWLRSVRPTFGRIPSSTLWFMNSIGLNVFVAVIGISAGPDFLAGLKSLGPGLFLWGIAATTIPLLLAIFTGRYVFRLDPAILFGACAGARTSTASLGMINEVAKSQVPALGYTVTYAIASPLLAMGGMIVVFLTG